MNQRITSAVSQILYIERKSLVQGSSDPMIDLVEVARPSDLVSIRGDLCGLCGPGGDQSERHDHFSDDSRWNVWNV